MPKTAKDPTQATSKLQRLKPVMPSPPSALSSNPPSNAPQAPSTRSITSPSWRRYDTELATKPAIRPSASHVITPINMVQLLIQRSERLVEMRQMVRRGDRKVVGSN